MKKIKLFKGLIGILFIISMVACMRNTPLDDDLPRYSSIDEIVNPPDEFLLVYNLNTFNNYHAYIQFEENAVWEIVRLTAPGFNFLKVERNDGSTSEAWGLIDPSIDTTYVGLEGNVEYDFWANRSSGTDENVTFLLKYTKQTIDYDSFSPKI